MGLSLSYGKLGSLGPYSLVGMNKSGDVMLSCGFHNSYRCHNSPMLAD